MRRTLIAFLLLVAENAYASSPFDGRWIGSSETTADCDIKFWIEMVITDGAISGAVIPERPTRDGYTRGDIHPGSSILPDGTANIVIGTNARAPAALRFTGDNF